MNSTSSVVSMTFTGNSSTINFELWFIPYDIFMGMCTICAIIVALVSLIIIILDKTCHTVPMILVANSFLTDLIFTSCLLSMAIVTLQNDLKQIQYQDSLCVLRAYIFYASGASMIHSFLLQAIHRYATVVYSTHLFWQSVRCQLFLICITWIFCYIYPIAFMFTGEIIYNVNNQICQLPFRLSFSIIYMVHCAYIIPTSTTMFIYFKLVRYVKRMSKRVIPVNILSRAQRELKMVRRTVILITILLILGTPYSSFIFVSFFTDAPKYSYRIGIMFMDASLACVMIILVQFTDPLKASIMKLTNRRRNVVVAAMT